MEFIINNRRAIVVATSGAIRGIDEYDNMCPYNAIVLSLEHQYPQLLIRFGDELLALALMMLRQDEGMSSLQQIQDYFTAAGKVLDLTIDTIENDTPVVIRYLGMGRPLFVHNAFLHFSGVRFLRIDEDVKDQESIALARQLDREEQEERVSLALARQLARQLDREEREELDSQFEALKLEHTERQQQFDNDHRIALSMQ